MWGGGRRGGGGGEGGGGELGELTIEAEVEKGKGSEEAVRELLVGR